MLNYLARLGWSHGDEELFSRAQMIEWFDGGHLARHPAQWDAAKLAWVNAHYLKALGDDALLALARRQLARRGIAHEGVADERLLRAAALFKDRCNTGADLAGWLAMLFVPVEAGAEERAQHVTAAVRPAFATLADKLDDGRLGRPRHRRGGQGNAGRARPEDGPARPGGAGGGLRPGADALARRRARPVPPRGRSGAAAEGRRKPRYNLGFSDDSDGGIAQLGERLHGMQEVSGSIPLTSTKSR